MIDVTFGKGFVLPNYTNMIIPVLDEAENVVGFLTIERDAYNIYLFARKIWERKQRQMDMYGSEEGSIRAICFLMDWIPHFLDRR